MKRFLSIILCIACLYGCIVTVSAGSLIEKEQYTIELPEGFYEVEESKFIGVNNDNFSVEIEENREDTICVAEMTASKAKAYAESLAEQSRTVFEAMNRDGGMEVLSADVYEHTNGKKALVTVFKTTAKKESGGETVRYQKICEFTCVNNKYSFIYTTEKEENLKNMDECFDSITINESENKGFVGDVGAYVAVGVIFGLFGLGIIRFIRTPAKRKAGKIKNKK